MIWVSFIIVALISGTIGAMVMALAVVAKKGFDEERSYDIYWSDRTDERRVPKVMP